MQLLDENIFFFAKTLWDNFFQIILKGGGHDTRMQKSGRLGDYSDLGDYVSYPLLFLNVPSILH
jgi:hypothetical protein